MAWHDSFYWVAEYKFIDLTGQPASTKCYINADAGGTAIPYQAIDDHARAHADRLGVLSACKLIGYSLTMHNFPDPGDFPEATGQAEDKLLFSFQDNNYPPKFTRMEVPGAMQEHLLDDHWKVDLEHVDVAAFVAGIINDPVSEAYNVSTAARNIIALAKAYLSQRRSQMLPTRRAG